MDQRKLLSDAVVTDVLEPFDYIQLVFDRGHILSIYNPIVGLPSDITKLIGKRVVDLETSDEAETIVFDDGTKARISLSENDYTGPEAMELSNPKENVFIVWN